MGTASTHDTELLVTPLHALHVELGAKMVPFAGYDMPVQYPLGVMGEHNHTREKAGLFDVSHMGQALLVGPDHETTAAALEALTPGDFKSLAPGEIGYTVLLNEEGGILDDLMVTRHWAEEGTLFLVVNAACKTQDFAHISANLPDGIQLQPITDRALIALQGPEAGAIFEKFAPASAQLIFMQAAALSVEGSTCFVSRSGYTGEDGFEISVPAADAEKISRALLQVDGVEAIGLGARDSLRLEAGLCLYGHDIDTTTTPAEGALLWAVPKRRRAEANFPGAKIILDQIASGAPRKRVGILPEGKAPAREGTEIQSSDGQTIGKVTSGGFGPSFGGPIAMGYVESAHAKIGTDIVLIVRGKARPAQVVKMPFVPQRYHRGL